MAETKVARRYAKSLLDLGIEKNLADQLYSDMSMVYATIRGSRELSNFLKSPVITTDKKNHVLTGLFSGKIQDMALDFFRIITRKKREYFIEEIALAYTELYDVYKGRQKATLITAVPADDAVRKQMLEMISKTTSDTIMLQEKVDPSIIGGFILKWGDRQVDASVAHKLHALSQEFKSNLYIKDY